MTGVSPSSRDPRGRLERLSNWLALLALLAGGVVFPGAGEATAAGGGAAAPLPCCRALPGERGNSVIAAVPPRGGVPSGSQR